MAHDIELRSMSRPNSERTDEESNLRLIELRMKALEDENGRLENKIKDCISNFEGKIMVLESNIKALRSEFALDQALHNSDQREPATKNERH